MKYIFQIVTMLSDIMIIFAAAIVLYFSHGSAVAIALIVLAVCAWSEQDGFIAWKPKNIKAFMKSWERNLG